MGRKKGSKNKTKLDRKIDVASKYKIDREYSPYMKVEYIHGKEHHVVEFKPNGAVGGVKWVDTPKTYTLRYFIAGMLWGCVLSWLVILLS